MAWDAARLAAMTEEYQKSVETVERLAVRIPEAAGMLSIGRSKLYQLIAAGDLKTVKVGRGTRVVVASIREFVARQ